MPAPLEMPPYTNSRKFDIDYAQQLSPSGDQGFIQTLNRGSPFWRAEYATAKLNELRWQEMTIFKDKLEGALGTFLAYDPRRPMPYAYRTQPITDDPWTQTGQVAPRITAFDYGASTITLDRLQNGAIISYGDYISALISGAWYLFRSMDQVASVVGNTATILVKPRPQILTFAVSNIRYRRACCEMKVIGKFDESDVVDDFPVMSWKAVQFIARAPT